MVAVSAPAPARRAPLLLRNAGFLAAGQVLERALGFGIAVWLARTLGADGYGTIGVAVSLLGFLLIAVASGTTPLAIREVARDPAAIPRLYARVAGLRLAVAGVVLGLLALGGGALARSLGVPPLLLGLYALGLVPVALACDWAFHGLERMHVVALGSLAERGLVLTGLWLFVRGPEPALWRVPVVEVGAAAALAAGYGALLWRRRPARATPRGPVTTRGRLLREGMPISLAVFLRAIYTQGDVVLLGGLASAAAAGLFLASHKLVLTCTILPTVLQQAAFPATSRWLEREPERAFALQADLLRWALLALVPVVVAASAAGERLLVLVFGGAYADAGAVLRIAVWTLPLVALAVVHRSLLLAAGAPKTLLLGVAAGAGVHVALAFALIPRAGAQGAAWACLLGEALGAACLAGLTHWRLGRTPLVPRTLAPFAAGALAFAPLAAPGLPLPGRAALAAAVYAAAALAFGAVRRSEITGALRWLRD